MVISLVATFAVLLSMFTYMFVRIVNVASQKDLGTYKPKMLLSIIELIVIIAIMFGLSYMAFRDEHSMFGVVAFSLVAFILSFFLINSKTLDTFDKALPIIATLAYFGFFFMGYI